LNPFSFPYYGQNGLETGPIATAGRWTAVLVPFSYWRMADPHPKTPELISRYAGPEWTPWAYCSDELGCGHNARIDIAAIIARAGDMPARRFRQRLRCSKCGKRARLVIGHR
jgi:hypothetical protein